MGDVFNEQLIRKLPSAKDYALKGLLGICAIAIMTLSIMYAGVLGVLIIIAVGAGLYFAYKLFDIEYEYVLTNDELDIDMIISRERRKHLITVNVKDIEVLAPLNGDYTSEFNSPVTKTLDASSHPASPKRWFAICRDGSTVTKLIFEPGKRIRAGIRQFNPRAVKADPNEKPAARTEK